MCHRGPISASRKRILIEMPRETRLIFGLPSPSRENSAKAKKNEQCTIAHSLETASICYVDRKNQENASARGDGVSLKLSESLRVRVSAARRALYLSNVLLLSAIIKFNKPIIGGTNFFRVLFSTERAESSPNRVRYFDDYNISVKFLPRDTSLAYEKPSRRVCSKNNGCSCSISIAYQIVATKR